MNRSKGSLAFSLVLERSHHCKPHATALRLELLGSAPCSALCERLKLKMQREAFEALDQTDPLAPLRDKFFHPPGVIYLDGNSLGALPRSTAARVTRVIEKEWGEDLITS